MPFFLIVPIWLLCVVAGAGLWFSKRLRFLSTHLILTSTLGLLLSFVFSTSVLWIGSRLLPPGSGWAGLALLGAYIIGLALGGLTGVAAGFLLALRINRRLQPA